MKILEKDSSVSLQFELQWQSPEAGHSEFYFAPRVNMWRDILPAEVENFILGARENETFAFAFAPGTVVSAFSAGKLLDLATRQFSTIKVGGHTISPQLGRFYPAGLLQNVSGVFPQALAPFRVVGLDNARIHGDLNHPLSLYALQLNIHVKSIGDSSMERGGRCTDWLGEITQNGPGMQARIRGQRTVFENPHSYMRQDEDVDTKFYATPRLVGHIDAQASAMLQEIYAKFLNRQDTVLDLMSSVESHLPARQELTVTGLGMNRAEMKKNQALRDYLVHDLNETPVLPFNNNTFDAVVCSLSIEYLTNPREIVTEISRVLVPGGRVLIGFSNRWFPPKVTRVWLEIHEFERLGLVLDYLLENGMFSDLHTFSARNWPRPADDIHSGKMLASDPVYVVTGTKKQQ